jgi:hypothetical protein
LFSGNTVPRAVCQDRRRLLRAEPFERTGAATAGLIHRTWPVKVIFSGPALSLHFPSSTGGNAVNTTWLRIPAISLFIAFVSFASARGDEEEIKFSECPAAVKKTMLDEAKGGKIDETVSKETEDGKTTYWASVVIDSKDYAIGVTEDGLLTDKVLDVGDEEVAFSNCPDAVRKTFREESKDATIKDVTKERKLGVLIYAAVVTLSDKEYVIKVAENGTLTEKVLVIEEDAIAFSSCPAAVQKTFRDESQGGNIDDVTRSSGLGGTVYEARVEINGKVYKLEVNEAGVLISKSLDEEDEAQ